MTAATGTSRRTPIHLSAVLLATLTLGCTEGTQLDEAELLFEDSSMAMYVCDSISAIDSSAGQLVPGCSHKGILTRPGQRDQVYVTYGAAFRETDYLITPQSLDVTLQHWTGWGWDVVDELEPVPVCQWLPPSQCDAAPGCEVQVSGSDVACAPSDGAEFSHFAMHVELTDKSERALRVVVRRSTFSVNTQEILVSETAVADVKARLCPWSRPCLDSEPWLLPHLLAMPEEESGVVPDVRMELQLSGVPSYMVQARGNQPWVWMPNGIACGEDETTEACTGDGCTITTCVDSDDAQYNGLSLLVVGGASHPGGSWNGCLIEAPWTEAGLRL